MPDVISISPLAYAVEKLSAKTPVGSILKSSDWAAVPAAIRERSLFSAGVESTRILSTIQDKLIKSASMMKEEVGEGKEAFVDSDSFIRDLKAVCRSEGIDTENPKLTNIGSSARLSMIYDFNMQSAYSFSRWKTSQDPDALLAFPAQEFLRVESRKVPRESSPDITERWSYRWNDAFKPFRGATAFEDGRMVARKNHPGWARLSAFGTPWEPFDFGSGMGIEDIDREEAIDLGIIEPDDTIRPAKTPFNAALEAELSKMEDWVFDSLAKYLGDMIERKGSRVLFKG